MANEITVNARLQVAKGNLVEDRQIASLSVNMAGTKVANVVQDIGTTYEAVDISSEIGTAGYAMFRNMGPTNFVEIGIEHSGTTFVPFVKLLAGEAAIVRLATKTIFAKADTAAVELQTFVAEA